MLDNAIIKYSCRLMDRRMAIGMTAVNQHRKLTDAEKAELEWSRLKMELIKDVQTLRREREINA
ncbi:hypothetical protein A5886_001841 [Enterococcus sp. 8G7_MSG3316]|uniref:Uncharacterized protein n=1 Tax=Candidatus Enterococcus testudinis TaxID=1834191 RepID=A0A242A730_9ENTE|nr:hypothetical protein A5886_001841 [Enterococcus sp. 8G7_MSG3316]